MDVVWLLLGVVLLYLGGEALVRGAVSLARASGLSPLVIGLTVVSFGTSSPELASSLVASLQGSPDIAFGNVVGSNIANVGLILGFTATIWPLRTASKLISREVPFMLLASLAVFWVVADGVAGRLEGAILFALLVAFLIYLLQRDDVGPEDTRSFETGAAARRGSVWWALVLVAGGVALLVGGAKALVAGATSLALSLGVSKRVVGLTIVALGTSLPELASSIVAAVRRQGDIVLGNIIGSNLFNILCILGLTALVRPLRLGPESVWIDLAVMLGLSVLVWPLLRSGWRLSRWEGWLLLAAYCAYLVYLF